MPRAIELKRAIKRTRQACAKFQIGDRVTVEYEGSGTVTSEDGSSVMVRIDADGVVVSCAPEMVWHLEYGGIVTPEDCFSSLTENIANRGKKGYPNA